MTTEKPNRRLAVPDPTDTSYHRLRVYRRKAQPTKAARILVKCGCCRESLIICDFGNGLEIGGVIASLAEWRRILDPLLKRKATRSPARKSGRSRTS